MTFQIVDTQRTLPSSGTGVHGRVSTDTGGSMVARAVGGLGGAVTDLGVGMFKAQGEAEFVQKMADAKQGLNEMYLKLETETDENKYDEIFQDTWSRLEDAEVKNGLAQREYKQSLLTMKPAQKAALNKAKDDRIWDKHTTALAWNKAQAIESGDPNSVYFRMMDGLLKTQVSRGRITQDDANLQLSETQEGAKKKAIQNQYEAAMTDAGVDPENVLKETTGVITSGGKWDRFGLLDIGQVRGIKNIAEGTIAERKREQVRLTTAIIDDTLKKAQTMSLTEFREQLRQAQGITEVGKTKLLETFIGGQKLWQDSGQDPWRETRDWPSYMQTKIDVAAGKITTPLQIYDKMLSDPQKGPLWSYVQMNDLVTDLPSEKSEILKVPFYEEWDKLIDALYIDANKDIPKEKIPEWARAKDQLKQIAATTANDYTKAQTQLEALVTPVAKKGVKQWIREWWNKVETTTEELGDWERENLPFGRLMIRRKKKEPVSIEQKKMLYQKTATNAKGEIMGFDGTKWELIQ